MRILFTCTDAEIGGAERFLASLAEARLEGDRVGLVVLMTRGSMSEQFAAAFDEVHYLDFPPTSRNLPGMVRALRRVIDEFRPDVISSHLFHADLVTALVRTPVPKTSTVHTQGFGPGDHPLTKAIARAVGMLSFRFSAIIPASSSPAMADFIRRMKMKNVVEPIGNGARIPADAPYDASTTVFLSLARNHPVKGHLELFSAFQRVAPSLPEWSLHAYGPGVDPDNTAMRSALEAAGATALQESGRLILHGPTAHPDHVIAEAGALVISSTYGEAFPIIGAEAAGAGLPVITTDVGSCSEFTDDPRLLIEPGNIDALAEAMRVFGTLDIEQREQLSRRARARAEAQYSPRSVYERYRSVFSRILPIAAKR